MRANIIDDFVLERIRHRVNNIVGRFGYTETDREDLQQELIVVILEAAPSFNPDNPKKAKWETFVRRVLDRRCVDIIRRQKAAIRQFDRNGFSLDDDCGGASGGASGGGGCVERDRRRCEVGTTIGLVELQLDIETVVSKLPPRQQQIARRMVAGHATADIAEEFGLSHRTTRRECQTIRQRLVEAGIGGAP